jgi:hypothetical protein
MANLATNKPKKLKKPKKRKKLFVKVPKATSKSAIKKRFKGNHNEILKHSLNLLIEDLLPVAVASYSDNPKQGAAYAVTNIISEIRGVIQQLESAVDADKILAAVSREVALSLRMSVTRMVGHITLLKEGLPLKVQDSGLRRDMALLLDEIMKEYDANMTEVITNVEIRVANAITEIVKGPKQYKKSKKSRKRKS